VRGIVTDIESYDDDGDDDHHPLGFMAWGWELMAGIITLADMKWRKTYGTRGLGPVAEKEIAG
jgi:hypothetical protein